MKVRNVIEYTEYFVETDDEDYGGDYRRSKGGSWERRMGESWESCYDSEEVEDAFQTFMASKGKKKK